MCGLVAQWNRDGHPVDLDALRSAVVSMGHRGPDDEGYVLIDTRTGRVAECGDARRSVGLRPDLEQLKGAQFDLVLGHRRLAIVDPSAAGHQPMGTTDGSRWIVFNGMIYNFPEIRRDLEARGYAFRSGTDTEVILYAYQEWGPQCVTRFNGMWAFVLWDQEARQLFVSRDRFGIKPLVAYRDRDVAAFSSELKGLVRLAGVPRRLRPEAVHHYLSLKYVPAPLTIYESIEKLLPGHSLLVDRRSEIDRCYWRPALTPPSSRAEQDALEQVHGLLRESVRMHLLGDAPVGALLSGGIDSSLVTAIATKEGGGPIRTFGLACRSVPEVDESRWAELVASHVNACHRSVDFSADVLDRLPLMIDLFDEPFAVSSVMGVYLLAREAAREVKVVLTGDGGDELFAGYLERYVGVDELWERTGRRWLKRLNRERIAMSSEWIHWERAGIVRKLGVAVRALTRTEQRRRDDHFALAGLVFNDTEKRRLYTPDWRARTRGLSTLGWMRSTLPASPGDGLQRWQAQDIRTRLHDEMLAKADKATMAWGVEARVPFLDHRLVEVAVNLPRSLKVANGQGKWILRRLGERYLPLEVMTRKKHGFDVPISQWLQGAWREFVRDTLGSSAARQDGMFRPEAVQRIVAHHDANPSFRSAHMVFALLCLQIWQERHRP